MGTESRRATRLIHRNIECALVPLKSTISAESVFAKNDLSEIIDRHNCRKLHARKRTGCGSEWEAKLFQVSRFHSAGCDDFTLYLE